LPQIIVNIKILCQIRSVNVRVNFIVTIIFGMGLQTELQAQNFVPNGSFELYTACPQNRNDGIGCSNWDAPTLGTSDYFNTCAPNAAANGISVPGNFAGTQMPRTGNAYTGIYASLNFTPPYLEYREYMQVTLDSLLVSGGHYTFTMYLSLGDYSNFASNKVGAYISKTKPSSNTNTYLNVTPQIISTTYITDKTNWVKVTGSYDAIGGEQYITIGVFEPASSHTRIAVTGGSNNGAYNGVSYYYIDDVSLTRTCDLLQSPTVDTTACVKLGFPLWITAKDSLQDSYLWNTGQTSQKINALQSGIYVVKRATSFCSVYDTVKVTRNMIPDPNFGGDIQLCETVDTMLDAGIGTSYLWNTGFTGQILHVTQEGKYKVTVTFNGCVNSDSVTVVASAKPNLDLGPDSSSCFQQPSTIQCPIVADSYLWSTGSTFNSITVTNAGTYWLQIQKEYCAVLDSIVINQKQVPNLDLGSDRSFCKEDSIQLNISQPNAAYVWNDGNNNAIRYVKAPARVSVSITSTDGCTVTDSLVLDTFTSPIISLGQDTAICQNNEVTLEVAAQYASYLWQNGSTQPVQKVSRAGLYHLVVTSTEGCKGEASISLNVNPLPSINLTEELKICDPDTFVTVSGSFTQLIWQDGSSNAKYPISDYGIFTVSVVDTNQCSNTANLKVENNCPGNVFVPNVFTPSNRDGVNDVFYPVTRNVEHLVFQIYNRYGEKVFETNKLKEGWDGLFEGRPAQADVYVYTIEYKTFSGNIGTTSGNVTLLK
jgi:gliding motility-associated-like protein